MKELKEISMSKVLTPEYLEELGFSHQESKFENYSMSYYVKDAICLFHNDLSQEWNKSSFLIGYGEMRMGKYYATTFRWITYDDDLFQIYEAITSKSLLNSENKIS